MHKKAFTLTELLVVVVILGVLASIVLPKFGNVLETRRTTEAENIMKTVREEQEARCTLGKNYLGPDKSDLITTLPKGEGQNYSYTLQEVGIKADSLTKNYTLWIPSYADGRICCSGEYCSQLNKDYPACEELQSQDDFIITNQDCETKAHDPQAPTPPQPCVAPEPKPAEEEDCECGKRMRMVVCDNNAWVIGAWDKSDAECKEPSSYEKTRCNPSYCTLEKRKVLCSQEDGDDRRDESWELVDRNQPGESKPREYMFECTTPSDRQDPKSPAGYAYESMIDYSCNTTYNKKGEAIACSWSSGRSGRGWVNSEEACAASCYCLNCPGYAQVNGGCACTGNPTCENYYTTGCTTLECEQSLLVRLLDPQQPHDSTGEIRRGTSYKIGEYHNLVTEEDRQKWAIK